MKAAMSTKSASSNAASRTAAADLDRSRHARPRISVIVPAIDEEMCLAATLESVRVARDVEIIVADGGSRDATVEVALSHGARIVRAPRGRALQMNAGAAVASAPVLVFLHADTLLPAGWDATVLDTLSQPRVVAGAFRLAFDRSSMLLGLIARVANVRSRWLRLPYGDQALFLRATTFADVGGFPEVPILEDVLIVRRLTSRGRLALCASAVTTSARRWSENGTLRTSALNSACLLAHFSGISTQRIAGWRRDRVAADRVRSGLGADAISFLRGTTRL